MTTGQIITFSSLLFIALAIAIIAMYREYLLLKYIHKIEKMAKGYNCVNIHRNINTKMYTVHMTTFMGKDQVVRINNRIVGMIIWRQINSKEYNNHTNELVKSLGKDAYLLNDVI